MLTLIAEEDIESERSSIIVKCCKRLVDAHWNHKLVDITFAFKQRFLSECLLELLVGGVYNRLLTLLPLPEIFDCVRLILKHRASPVFSHLRTGSATPSFTFFSVWKLYLHTTGFARNARSPRARQFAL